VVGGVLSAGKGSQWRVNHYQSGEAILGWLALQPVEHQLTLDTLSDETLDDLGSALGSVQKAMKRVWTEHFPDDPLVRIHTVNFMEREFDQPSPQESFHVHIFLIPRSKLLGKVIREQLAEGAEKQYVAWHDYKVFQRIKDQDSRDLLEMNIPWDKLQRYINSSKDGRKDLDDKIEKFMNRFRQAMTKS
jgi:diadenosine tetraphosphate (Ap4A) HIT family hydrolase